MMKLSLNIGFSLTKHGYLLTTQWEDRGNKHLLKYYGVSDDGPFCLEFDQERPLFFIERDSAPKSLRQGVQRKQVSLKTMQGRDVDSLYFSTQRELYAAKDSLSQEGIRTYEADVRSTERFLMERFVYGSIDFEGSLALEERGLKIYRNPSVKAGPYHPKLSTISVDIETSMGSDLFSIGIHYKDQVSEVKKVYMVGDDQGPMGEGELFYFSSEKSCYEAFEKDFLNLDPDILIGWHVIGFDLKFLEMKCQQFGIELGLGRRGSRVKLKERKGAGWFAQIEGRVVVDGPPSMRAAFYSFEDFKLDTVAHSILGEKKDISSTAMEKVKEIERRFHEDKPSLAKYNLLDCELVSRIYEKVGLIDLLITRTKLSGMLMDRVGVSTAAFDFFMLPKIHRKGFVSSNIVDVVRDVHAAGGYVLEPMAGLHEHIIVLDFKSLYPSIIQTFKIDPYSRIMAEEKPQKNPAGILFSKDNHILPEFITKLMQERSIAKEQGNSHLSQAIKILMNSFYGVMGSSGSRFYHADLPTAITGTGQWVLRETIEYFEKQGHKVVYGDTDSVFIQLSANSRTGVFEKGELLAQKGTEHIRHILKKHFDAESELVMEFEKYYRKFFLPMARNSEGGAKKKYAGLIQKITGEAEVSFSGMEFVRSDWTHLAKNFQMKIFQHFFKDEDIEDCIREEVEALKAGERDNELVYKKRLTKDIDEYTKSIPPHVKAARQLREKGIEIPRKIEYLMTRQGPVPCELGPSDIDYQHYIDKQIRPIAETILIHFDKTFDHIITGDQLSLF